MRGNIYTLVKVFAEKEFLENPYPTTAKVTDTYNELMRAIDNYIDAVQVYTFMSSIDFISNKKGADNK